MEDYDFGALIKATRESKNQTQEEFAGGLGVSRHSVVRWENNHEVPADEHLYTLERMAKLPAQYLVRRKQLAKMKREGWDLAGMFNDPDLLADFGVTLGLTGKAFVDGPAVTPEARRAAALAQKRDWKGLMQFALDHIDPTTPEGPANPPNGKVRGSASRAG